MRRDNRPIVRCPPRLLDIHALFRHTRASIVVKVTYVTMVFPKASEAFAWVDVLALHEAGVDVRVLALQPPVREYDDIVQEHRLERIDIETGTLGRIAAGIGICIRRPRQTLALLGFALRHSWKRPGHFIRSKLLIPRAMGCFARIEELRPDVVHLFWGHYPSLVGYLIERYHPEIVLSHFLGAYDLEYRYGPSVPVAQRADVLWTHARANLSKIRALGITRDDVRVVHRGVSADGSDAVPVKSNHAIVAAGRLRADKGFEDVLAVFERVLRRDRDARLVIAGDGSERARLERTARRAGLGEAVTFAGHVSQPRLFDLFAGARVFLLMSRSPTERLPNVIKEAALRGCVPVTTRTDGIDELVTDGVDGYIVPPGDVDGAAARIIELVNDSGRADAMAAALQRKVVESFDARLSMTRYRDAWRELIERKT